MTDQRTEKEYLINIHSDLFKDVYGFRPRHFNYSEMSETDIDEDMDRLQIELRVVQDNEKIHEEKMIHEFKETIKKVIEAGADNEETALRWMIQTEDKNWFDAEHWVWEHGFLFTQYGRDVISKINSLEEV